MPEETGQKASPWLALYVGLTILLTLVIIFSLDRQARKEMKEARRSLEEDLARDTDATLFSRLTFWNSPKSDVEATGLQEDMENIREATLSSRSRSQNNSFHGDVELG